MMQKTCGKCHHTKDRIMFNRNHKHPDGLQSKCRTCEQQRNKLTEEPRLDP